MASANVPVENPFLTQIERVRVELRERVARAHQLLQKRETALLSELQQLEDTYRGEIKLSSSLETARDIMRRVELEWDRNLRGILSRAKSIRVVFDYSVKEDSAMLVDDHTKIRDQAACEAKTESLLTANIVYCHSLPLTTNESRIDISQTTYNMMNSSEKQLYAENTEKISKDNQIYPTNPSNNFIKPFDSSRTQCKPASTTATILSSNNSSKFKTSRLLISPIIPITPNKCIDIPTYTHITNIGSHEFGDDPRQYTMNITECRGITDYIEKGNAINVAGKLKASSEVQGISQLTSDDYAHQSICKGDTSLSSVIIESKVNSSQRANYTTIKLKDKFQDFDNENTHANPTSGKSQSYSTKPISSSPTSPQEYESATTSPTALSYGGSSSNCSFPSSTQAHSITKKQTIKRTHSSPGYTSGTSANFHDTRVTKTVFPESVFYEPQQTICNIVEGEPIGGLKNRGSTCYMNCILQCLSHTIHLRQFYVSDDYRQYLNNRGDLSTAFKDVIIKLWNTTLEYSVDPYDLKREVRAKTDIFSDNRQHDAHEFMRFLLNKLHEEINRASEEGRKSPADNETLGEACARYLTWEDSRISQLFSGMLRSQVCCSVCNNQSTAYIPFMDIALPILKRQKRPYYLYFSSSYPSIRLSDCFKTFTTRETLNGKERPYCNKCKNLTKSTKQVSLAKLPEFLVIHLKRFSYYPKRSKLSTHVEFDDTWSLKDFANNTHTYSLYGIVSHSGSICGGHYIAFCKYNGIWRCFDDSIISIVSWEYVKNQEAYILLYTENIYSDLSSLFAYSFD